MNTQRPLEGITVLDFTRIYSGPYCSMLLGDLGAYVIKVEKKGTGDDSRQFRPKPNIKEGSGYTMYLNRNKKSVELDLKDETARGIIYRLCEKADIVLENYAPGVAKKLGIDYDTLKKYNPQIIYGSISGFGQTGPYRNKAAYDIIAQAMGGYMAVTGPKNGMPIKLGTSVGDSCAGLHMAFALMAAMYYRQRTGIGQYIDISMMDSVFATLENHVMIQTMYHITPVRNGNSNQNAVPFNTTKHTTKEVCQIFEDYKIPVGPILGIDQLVEDPHILAREMMIEVDHPYGGKIRMPGCPIKFSETKIDHFAPSSALGADTAQVLREIGGYTQKEIEDLAEAGIIPR